MRRLIDIKGKVFFLFQSNYIKLQSVVPSITSRKHTIQAIPSKKKKRRKGKSWKREEEEKWMERVCSEGKRKGRMRCGRKDEEEGEGEGKEEEKEKQKMEKAIHERHRPLQKYSLARS